MSTAEPKATTPAPAESPAIDWKAYLTGPTARNTAIVLLVIGIGYFTFRYFSNRSLRQNSTKWTEVEVANDLTKLESLIAKYPDEMPGRAAALHRARVLLYQGLEGRQTDDPKDAETALNQIQTARDAFAKLAEELKDQPLLRIEAYINAAKAEESLIGTPVPNNPGQSRGSIDKVIEFYRQAASAATGTKVAEEMTRKAEDLLKNREQVVTFYTKLYTDGLRKPPEAKEEPILPKITAPIEPSGPYVPPYPVGVDPKNPALSRSPSSLPEGISVPPKTPGESSGAVIPPINPPPADGTTPMPPMPPTPPTSSPTPPPMSPKM